MALVRISIAPDRRVGETLLPGWPTQPRLDVADNSHCERSPTTLEQPPSDAPGEDENLDEGGKSLSREANAPL